MRLLTPVLVLCALAALDVHVAEAQLNRPTRPYRGLFQGGTGDAQQSLQVNVSLGGGYDDNFRAEATGGTSRGSVGRLGAVQGGRLGSLSGSVAYLYTGTKVSIDFSGGTAMRYYPEMELNTVSSQSVSLGSTYAISRRTTLATAAAAIYRPFSLAGLFLEPDGFLGTPVETPVIAVDQVDLNQAGNLEQFGTYRGTIDLNHEVSNRTSAHAGYNYRTADARSYGGTFTQHSARVGVDRQISRDLSLGLGYGLRLTDFAGRPQTSDHIINVGINYNPTLSFSRRTLVSFGTGSSAVSRDNRRIYRATGSATLTHQIGRTWSAAAVYNRGLRFIETIQEPIFADSASVSFGGLISSRLKFSSGAQASVGSLGGTNMSTRSGNVGLEYGINRHIAVQVTYGYFQYEFDQRVSLPAGVPRVIERQSAKVQVSLWAPVFQRARKPNATR